MFGPNNFTTPFSFGKVLGGLSKTLGVVNRVIPIYKEARPMIQNAKNAINLFKEFSNNSTNRIISNTEKNMKPIKDKINDIKINNVENRENKKGPTFFQ